MKCDKCGYDDNGSGDTAHACTFYQSLSQPVKTPQRTWVGLDHHDKKTFSSWLDHKSDDEVFSAIEAKLKELNT